MKKCDRCGSEEQLEGDHITPTSCGGSDDPENKRWLCQPCHKYRHTRDSVIAEIDKMMGLSKIKRVDFNAAKFSMWIMRLGVLEAFNTPELIRARKRYVPYWDIPTTHYSRWYPQIKIAKKQMRELEPIMKLTDFIVESSCFDKGHSLNGSKTQ